MTPTSIWHWITLLPGFDVGKYKGSLGRAVAAFSHILSGEGVGNLFWAMLGLEALYGSGSANLTKQLRDYSTAFLGNSSRTKSLISKMYDFRSRFIHGDMVSDRGICKKIKVDKYFVI